MTKPTMTQLVTVVALLAAAAFGPGTGNAAGTTGLLSFGLANALLALPGTRWVRTVSICGAMAALLWPAKLLVGLGILAWLAWPPAFLVAWALGSPPRMETDDQQQSDSANGSRIALAAIILAVALASIAFRLFVMHRLEQTAALFIGIPTLLAIVVVVVVSPRSATGVAVKAATVGLLVSLLFLGEGILCIAMSAPLFLLVAVACARVGDWANRQSRPTGRLLTGLFVLTTVPMSLEGVTSHTTLERNQTIVESRVVLASADAVGRAILESPRFDRPRPLYLRAGFPTPIATRIDGGTWVIRFRGGEMRVDGLEPRVGDCPEARGVPPWICSMDRALRQQSHDAFPHVAGNVRAVGTGRFRQHPSDRHNHVSAKPRPCRVLRAMATVCRSAGRRLSDRGRCHAMTRLDPYLLVRAASVYLALVSTIAVWFWRAAATGSGCRRCPRIRRGTCRSFCFSMSWLNGLAGGASTRGDFCSVSHSSCICRGYGYGARSPLSHFPQHQLWPSPLSPSSPI